MNPIQSLIETISGLVTPIVESFGMLYTSMFKLYAFVATLGGLAGLGDFGGF